MMKSYGAVPRLSFRAGVFRAGSRDLPAEVAVALSYNGSTHAVMMATPADLADFARGFTLTEGIATPDEIESIDAVETAHGIDLQIWLSPPAAERQAGRRRTMAGPVGCGLCGLDSLEEAMRRPVAVPDTGFAMTTAEITAAVAALEGHQPLHDKTRAAHGALLWQAGDIVLSREDVGRHNALDKLIGAVQAGSLQADSAALVLTCRSSVDMVQKACVAGFPMLIAVSAPTATAVDMAHAAGLTLIGLARADGFDCFTHSHRITQQEAAYVA